MKTETFRNGNRNAKEGIGQKARYLLLVCIYTKVFGIVYEFCIRYTIYRMQSIYEKYTGEVRRMPFEIIRNDIVKIKVNTAIHKAAAGWKKNIEKDRRSR